MRFSSFSSVGCGIFLACLAGFAPAVAQQKTNAQGLTSDEVIARAGVAPSAVAAVINDKIVSTFDVRQRVKLMLISSGGQIPPEAIPQIQAQALRDLVEERLKLQEVGEYEIDITDAQVTEELTYLAAQSNLTLAQLLETLGAAGITVGTLRTKIQADIAWPQLVQGRYRDRVRVNKDEIESTLERMREDASKEQYLVSEICIPVDNPSQAQQYYQGSMQLIEQMRRGVPFTVVAQQFSACTTAAVGGDLGWVRAGELAPELDSALRELPPGSVTNPIPSDGAFMILAVRDKREAAVAGKPTYTLAYGAADKSLGNAAAHTALDQLETAEVCSGRALRIDLGKGVEYSLIENVTLEKIAPTFRPFIEDLARGDKSAVIEADGAYHSVYVCDKDDGLGLPSREALENRVYQRQLDRIGQQYLRDVERGSMVDIRMKISGQPNG